MQLPRMSVSALSARLTLERAQVVLIVEGQSDQAIIDRWAEKQGLPIATYCVADIEIDLDVQFTHLGGNKGRVASLLSAAECAPYANDNLYGLIDKDLDDALGRTITLNGLLYTPYANLPAEVLDEAGICAILDVGFHKKLGKEVIDELDDYSRREFCVRAWKIVNGQIFRDIAIGKYVRKISDGGFHWEKYIHATGITNKIKDIVDNPNVVFDRDTSGDIRLYRNDHAFISYAWELLRKESVIDGSVRSEELNRHVRWLISERAGRLHIALTLEDIVRRRALHDERAA